LEQNRLFLVQHAASVQETEILARFDARPIFTPAIASLLCRYAPYAQSLRAAIEALHLEKRLTTDVLDKLIEDKPHIVVLCKALTILQQ
ncbi:hypothetical protein ABTJ52_20760, partial [Acinetobacter baumannii]